MKKWQIALVALLVTPAAAFAQEAEVMVADEAMEDEVRAEIEAIGAEFSAALNGDDPASAADTYTEDAVVMPPNMDALEGRDAIREFFAEGMDGGQLALDTWNVQASGDQAIETGGYTITGADGSHLDHGKYVVVLTQTDDGWKMKYDIWNSSMAPAATDHEAMREKMQGEAHEMKEEAEEMKEEVDDAVDDM
jgi:uncharacterized protein (TIGR02246 family)